MDEDGAMLPPSAQDAMEDMAEAARAAQDTCFALSERYREAIEKTYPRPPDFPPMPCVAGSGRKVVMTCAPSGAWKDRLEGRVSVVKIDEDSGIFAEYACKTVPIAP